MKRAISRFILWITGWKVDKEIPNNTTRCVVAMAPHTSNWDFVLGRLALNIYGVKAKMLVKKELFFFPLGFFLKRMGAIPVDRKKKTNITQMVVDLYKKHDDLVILFTPEGTRSYQPNWKKGFYYVAQKAEVPILIAYIDYKKRTGGFGPEFTATGDVDKDIETIKSFCRTITPKHPDWGVK
jgi:1-acyl-sn-glycerol-3-phosphate acyltransferase